MNTIESMWKRLKFNIGRRLILDWLFDDWDRATFFMLDLMNWARCYMTQRDFDALRERLKSEDYSFKGSCMECGAHSPREAETMCICGGDKDHCHGVDLWES